MEGGRIAHLPGIPGCVSPKYGATGYYRPGAAHCKPLGLSPRAAGGSFPAPLSRAKPAKMTGPMNELLNDPVALSQALIRQPTVNPCHDGAQDLLAEALESLGFRTRRYHFEGVDNLWARIGTASPNFCFAGHTDVVP